MESDGSMILTPSDEPDLNLPTDLDSLEKMVDLIKTVEDVIDDFGLATTIFVGLI